MSQNRSAQQAAGSAALLAVKGVAGIFSAKVLAIVAVIALGLGGLGLFVAGVAVVGGFSASSTTQIACVPGGPALGANVSGVNGEFEGYPQPSLERAAIIMNTAEDLGVGRKGQLIALITAMQESTLGANTQPTGSGRDAGVFQQRTLPGWYGTVEQVNDPAYATTKFIEGHDIDYAGPGSAGPAGYHLPGLTDLPGWESMSPGAAAQAVQVSAHPDAYDAHVDTANRMIDHLSGATVTPGDTAAEVSAAAACEPSQEATGEFEGAQNMEQLPHFPMPEGCSDQTPLFGPYGPSGLNGNVPDAALCTLPGALDADGRAQARAVAAYVAMNEEFRAEFGRDLTVTSTYRTFAKQQSTKASKGYWAATPGWSNHGFGLAIDIQASPLEKRWVQSNGPRFGWWHPLWARADGRKPENWHYEYGTWLVAPEYEGMDPAQIAY